MAVGLGQAGADVVVNFVRGQAAADEVVGEIEKAGSRAYAHRADVSDEGQVQAMFQKMFSEFGTIDILINNAGLQKDAPFYESLMQLVPYKRIGEPDDIARAAVWLASDQADYINGVSLIVDGGMTLYPGFATGG